MDIKLRFFNHSIDGNTSEVVIYQKNLTTSIASLSMAWKVIHYCGRDCYHPFVYPDSYEVAVADGNGSFSPRMQAQNGQRLQLLSTPTGSRRLSLAGNASASNELELLNMSRGAIDVHVFNDGRIIGIETSVVPGQKAVFQYKPALWVTVASQVIEGMAISSAVMSNVATEISLIGIASADVVMTGGGPGEYSTPYQFKLENTVQI